MSRLEKNVLDDYDELMNFEHDTIGDLKYDLNSLKIRDRIAELQKENTMLVKENKEALEMVEKLMNDNTELEATLDDNTLQIKNTIELEKENAELKKQIDRTKEAKNSSVNYSIKLQKQIENIKYLNFKEVEDVIVDYKDFLLTYSGFHKGEKLPEDKMFWEEYYKAINKIIALATPITKEKIIIKYKKRDLILINGKKLVLRKREILGDDNENK